MRSPHALTVPLALGLGLGCTLLQGYPGGGDPNKALADEPGSPGTFNRDIDGDGIPDPIDGNEPLVDPAIDSDIRIYLFPERNEMEMGCPTEEVVLQRPAIPGGAFTIGFRYCATEMNVVGGGIRFPGSNEVQWTFIEGADQFTSQVVDFAYVVAGDACDEIPPLCHSLETEIFAVARNTKGDVDGDGEDDGQFVVSQPQTLDAVLMCATCESPSCVEVYEQLGDCAQCAPAPECEAYRAACLDPEQFPGISQNDIDSFDQLFGDDGVLWKSTLGCEVGTDRCGEAFDNFNNEGSCTLGGGEEGEGGSGDSGGMGGSTGGA